MEIYFSALATVAAGEVGGGGRVVFFKVQGPRSYLRVQYIIIKRPKVEVTQGRSKRSGTKVYIKFKELIIGNRQCVCDVNSAYPTSRQGEKESRSLFSYRLFRNPG